MVIIQIFIFCYGYNIKRFGQIKHDTKVYFQILSFLVFHFISTEVCIILYILEHDDEDVGPKTTQKAFTCINVHHKTNNIQFGFICQGY